MNLDETVNTTIDPQGSKLLHLEQANHSVCDFLASLGCDGNRLRISAPRRGAKKCEITQPQSKERIELLRKAKTVGAIFAVTHGEHLNSGHFFKARAMDDRKKEAEAMLKEKRIRCERQKLRQQALAVLKEHGEPTEENIKNYPAPAMKKLCQWKHNEQSTEGREKLLKAYLGAPVPLKEPDWSMSEEIKLKALLTEDMHAKDTAIGVQLRQTAKTIANNIEDLDKETRLELLQALQDKEKEDTGEDDGRGII